MTSVPIDLVLGGGSLLDKVARDLRTVVERQLAPLSLTAQQAALLLVVLRGETSPVQLAAALGTDTAGMTRLIDRLAAKGMIERRRHPTDRRSIAVNLTAEGKAVAVRLPMVFGRATNKLLAGFSTAEVQQLSGLLHRMLDNLRRDADSRDDGTGTRNA